MDGLHPDLKSRLTKILAAMDALGFPMKVCQGLRTVEQQQALYAQGRTVPGKIVTNCDGLLKKSNHQAQPDGFGYAADCCFLGPDPFNDLHPWQVYGACAQALGLKWGGQWKSLPDKPHVELKR